MKKLTNFFKTNSIIIIILALIFITILIVSIFKTDKLNKIQELLSNQKLYTYTDINNYLIEYDLGLDSINTPKNQYLLFETNNLVAKLITSDEINQLLNTGTYTINTDSPFIEALYACNNYDVLILTGSSNDPFIKAIKQIRMGITPSLNKLKSSIQKNHIEYFINNSIYLSSDSIINYNPNLKTVNRIIYSNDFTIFNGSINSYNLDNALIYIPSNIKISDDLNIKFPNHCFTKTIDDKLYLETVIDSIVYLNNGISSLKRRTDLFNQNYVASNLDEINQMMIINDKVIATLSFDSTTSDHKYNILVDIYDNDLLMVIDAVAKAFNYIKLGGGQLALIYPNQLDQQLYLDLLTAEIDQFYYFFLDYLNNQDQVDEFIPLYEYFIYGAEMDPTIDLNNLQTDDLIKILNNLTTIDLSIIDQLTLDQIYNLILPLYFSLNIVYDDSILSLRDEQIQFNHLFLVDKNTICLYLTINNIDIGGFDIYYTFTFSFKN